MAPPTAGTAPVTRRSIIVAALSTAIEWYDFTLYLYMATVLSRVFFADGERGLLVTYLSFGVAYLMRPVGAMVFGHIGDRAGRKVSMLIAMALMSAAMFATAALPTHAAIGAWSGILMIALRLAMAFSVGGEYTGVVAYLMEGSPTRRRGIIASCAAAASEIGALFAALAAALTVTLVPAEAVTTWGWRIPFLFGGALALLVLLLRSTIDESPEFERQRAAGTVPERPLSTIWRTQRRAIAYTFTISAVGSITYYVGVTYLPGFLTSAGVLAEADSLWVSTLAAVAIILVTPIFGWASDRWGRRPVLLGVIVAAGVVPAIAYSVMGSAPLAVVALCAVGLAVVAGGVSAVAASATPEQFPGEGRLSGLALGVTAATAVFGGITPAVAQRWVDSGLHSAPGWMIAIVAVVALIVLRRLPETAPQHVAGAAGPGSRVA